MGNYLAASGGDKRDAERILFEDKFTQ